jgi:hypothetical protein
MTFASSRRTTGIRKNMVGKAMHQEIIQELIHLAITPVSRPMARKVATPETRKVITSVSAKGSANRM